MMRSVFSAVALLIAASCLANAQAPNWNPVALTPPVVEYWGGSTNPLVLQWPNSTSTSYPIYMYYPTSYSGPGTTDAYGCQWRQSLSPTTNSIGSSPNAYSPEYPEWATGSSFNSNTQLTGPIPRAGVAQVSVGYQVPWGTTIRGVSMEASFPGGSQGVNNGPSLNFFWESDNCADGDTEYGFTLSQVNGAQNTQFYYSYWTNCGNPAIDPSYADSCWAIAYAPGWGLVVTSVVQCTGAVNMPVSVSPNSSYYYNAYPYANNHGTWSFMAQVTDANGNSLESCSVDPASGSNSSCWPNTVAPGGFVTNVTKYGSCTTLPATSTTQFNTSTTFNPQWTSGVGGWVFAVMDGSSSSQFLSNWSAPAVISSIRVGQ